MKDRYRAQVERPENTTLYENFPAGGTCNHAWNAPNAVLSRQIVGIEPTAVAWRRFQVLPNLAHLTAVRQVVDTVRGVITVDIERQSDRYEMKLNVPAGIVGVVGIPKQAMDITEISVNNVPVWRNDTYKGGVGGIAWQGEDNKYIRFELEPGAWHFNAK